MTTERKTKEQGGKTMSADAKKWLQEADDKIYKGVQELEDASNWLEEPGPKEFLDIKKELDEAIADLEFVHGMIDTLRNDLDKQAQEDGE